MIDENTYKVTASEALAHFKDGSLTVHEYATALLARIAARDADVQAWAFLDPAHVLAEAARLDSIPIDFRGPLHGVTVAAKDIFFTKGKATTAEFAATNVGPKTKNPHDPLRTPGGSSSGSATAVRDFQAPVALATQTGGSTIRPGSFNGIYALKPTWNVISREGVKIYSVLFDPIGLYARSVDNLTLLADVLNIHDDEPAPGIFSVRGARFAVVKIMVWPKAGPGTVSALMAGVELLRKHGATVEEIELPPELDELPQWHRTWLAAEGRTSFLPEHRMAKGQLDDFLVAHVENRLGLTRAAQAKAFDSIAAARPVVDEIASRYAALLTPSDVDEAPVGTAFTGAAVFNCIWTPSKLVSMSALCASYGGYPESDNAICL
ncbi:hypothetical protein SBRCBS47491_007540 [Sporothrix bragantina]|uniref:Amidase domain-containing protein n=1 Tax=Sporothrix bragantina TaxID=671064 RepID=A0ABP0CDZ7_9PEZI